MEDKTGLLTPEFCRFLKSRCTKYLLMKPLFKIPVTYTYSEINFIDKWGWLVFYLPEVNIHGLVPCKLTTLCCSSRQRNPGTHETDQIHAFSLLIATSKPCYSMHNMYQRVGRLSMLPTLYAGMAPTRNICNTYMHKNYIVCMHANLLPFCYVHCYAIIPVFQVIV